MDDIRYLSISELNRIIKMKFDASKFFNKVGADEVLTLHSL